MDKLIFKGEWNAVKGKLELQYGLLTADDPASSEGWADEMTGRLQQEPARTKIGIPGLISANPRPGGN